MIDTYRRILNDDTNLWSHMVAVITKVDSTDYEEDELEEWTKELQLWKENLEKEFVQRFNGANPAIITISQDMTKPNRKENKKGSDFHSYMIQEMKSVHAIAV